MAADKLTKSQIERMKPAARTYRHADGKGLYLQVDSNGSRYWRLAYRYGGKQKTLAFGVWPEVDLDAAREKRDAARKELQAGRDPGAVFKGVSFGGATFGELAREVLLKMERERRADATMTKNRWLLMTLAEPIRGVPLADLDAPTIQALLETVERSGRYETAIRLRGAIGGVFRHAIRTARATVDPTAALAGGLTQPPVKHHAAVTAPKAVGRLMLAIDTFSGAKSVGLALKLLPYLFVRPGELRGMHWREFDKREREWVIPAERTKQRREHAVPLPLQALEIFEELHALTGPDGFVFPNARSPVKCMSEGALAAALASIGYGPDICTPHGFRSTASTLLTASRKFRPDVIEAQLAHLPADKVRAIYNRHAYWEERVEMMRWWANELDRLKKTASSMVRILG